MSRGRPLPKSQGDTLEQIIWAVHDALESTYVQILDSLKREAKRRDAAVEKVESSYLADILQRSGFLAERMTPDGPNPLQVVRSDEDASVQAEAAVVTWEVLCHTYAEDYAGEREIAKRDGVDSEMLSAMAVVKVLEKRGLLIIKLSPDEGPGLPGGGWLPEGPIPWQNVN